MEYFKFLDIWVDEPNIATTYIEVDRGCEIRRVSVLEQRFISSNIDLLLGEGQVDYSFIDEDETIVSIQEQEFLKVWNINLEKHISRWRKIKETYPVGSNVVGAIKIFFPQGVIINLGNNIWGLADYKQCRDSTKPEFMYPPHKVTGVVSGYDEIQHWINIADPQVHQEELSANT